MDLIAVFVPFLLGMAAGNLDPNLAKVYKSTTPIVLPYMGCCFGASINLVTAIQAGIAGILLSVIYLFLHIAILLPVDRSINHRPGYAAMAMCSVAGLALTVPSLMSGGEYTALAANAIPQIAACLIITSIASSFLTKVVVKNGEIVQSRGQICTPTQVCPFVIHYILGRGPSLHARLVHAKSQRPIFTRSLTPAFGTASAAALNGNIQAFDRFNVLVRQEQTREQPPKV